MYNDISGATEGFFMGMPAHGLPAWQGGVAWPPPPYYAPGPCSHEALSLGYPQNNLAANNCGVSLAEKVKPGPVVFELAEMVPEPLSVITLTPSSPPSSPPGPRTPPPSCPAPALEAPPLPSPPVSEPVTQKSPALIQMLAGDPHSMSTDGQLSAQAVEHLDGDCDVRSEILTWMQPAMLELALSACGCRVMQKAVEVAGGAERTSVIELFRGHVTELVLSPNGNHVLQKCIEVMPWHTVQFILEELAAFPGSWLALSQHCFGCRVAERLLEHCPEEHTAPIVAEVIVNAQALCRHPYGNYVVQHVLEYSSPKLRVQLVKAVVQDPDLGSLAQHRMASHVIERMLELPDNEGRLALVDAILAQPPALLRMACSRCGSFLTQRLLELPLAGMQGVEVFRQLSNGIEQLRSSKHGKMLARRIEELSNPPTVGMLCIN